MLLKFTLFIESIDEFYEKDKDEKYKVPEIVQQEYIFLFSEKLSGISDAIHKRSGNAELD